jgi:hypothetical protein
MEAYYQVIVCSTPSQLDRFQLHDWYALHACMHIVRTDPLGFSVLMFQLRKEKQISYFRLIFLSFTDFNRVMNNMTLESF